MYWPVGPPLTFRESCFNGSRPRKGSVDDIEDSEKDRGLISIVPARQGVFFATLSPSAISVWWPRPVSVIAAVSRKQESIEEYGRNIEVYIHSNSADIFVLTDKDYIIVYSLSVDASEAIFSHTLSNTSHSRPRTDLQDGLRIPMAVLRYRSVIRLPERVSSVVLLEEGIFAPAFSSPVAYYVRWTRTFRMSAEDAFSEKDASFEFDPTNIHTLDLSSFPWLEAQNGDFSVRQMEFDRRMGIGVWVLENGLACVVRVTTEPDKVTPQITGYIFHTPTEKSKEAQIVSINARFSLIAVGCRDSSILLYSIKDYQGNVVVSRRLTTPQGEQDRGLLASLIFSPDGYCLYSGYADGWILWSVFGRRCASSEQSREDEMQSHDKVHPSKAAWLANGFQLAILNRVGASFTVLKIAKNAITSFMSPASIKHSLLQIDSGAMIYRSPDYKFDPSEPVRTSNLWEMVTVPKRYIKIHWPLRMTVISPDGRYLAVSGRYGLAHFSIQSGRWRTFDSEENEREFSVRGGMSWFGSFLVAAVETASKTYELRVYFRERLLAPDQVMQKCALKSPVVHISPSGQESLLVYTQDNNLHHYIVNNSGRSLSLELAGQLALHGIVRSPLRVRGISWIVPELQLRDGEPSKDVTEATVVFLVDDKLVVLHPCWNDQGEVRYEIRIAAEAVEYYIMMRDSVELAGLPGKNPAEMALAFEPTILQDSLWYFEGTEMRTWPGMSQLLETIPRGASEARDPVKIELQGYPVCVQLKRGSVLCLNSTIEQHRNCNFSSGLVDTRNTIFIPKVLEAYLRDGQLTKAILLASSYQDLSYFSLALEMLLHDVLSRESDGKTSTEESGIPRVITFISSFTQYLDVVANTLRKSELSWWPALLRFLPSPSEMFEEALAQSKLTIAASFLFVITTLGGEGQAGVGEPEAVRLLQAAKHESDWKLCKELSRFLFALDDSGEVLRRALESVDFT